MVHAHAGLHCLFGVESKGAGLLWKLPAEHDTERMHDMTA